MIKVMIVVFILFSCSKKREPYLSEFRASPGCRDVYSCGSCTENERCDVTERDPEGWPTARECCPK